MDTLRDNRFPRSIMTSEWKEIALLPEVVDAWGLESSESWEVLASMCHGARFAFESTSPGYVGDLFLLQGDELGQPMTIIREGGKLVVVDMY